MQSPAPSDRQNGVTPPRPAGNAVLAIAIATVSVLGFYGLIAGISLSPMPGLADPLNRYFAGHPVAVAATILFGGAIGILGAKFIGVLQQRSITTMLLDSDLAPPSLDDPSPADAWRHENDAGHVASTWLDHLATMGAVTFESRLVVRLREILVRRSDRGSGSAVGDDLRELATRDADAAHDSLGLVRIIIWAIPMLGFLGTVIGITQTLGGLDFTDGQAAVDSLKVGLNVAFDTTALGLVLSVVAIFLQFPVERAETELLAEIDARVGRVVSKHLPSQDAADDQTTMISELCSGIETAVAQSLSDQTKLWRSTIDEAQSHWADNHENQHDAFVKAFEVSLIPSLQSHAESFRSAHQTTNAGAKVVAEATEVLEQSTVALEHTTGVLAAELQTAIGALQSSIEHATDQREIERRSKRELAAEKIADQNSIDQKLAEQNAVVTNAMVVLARAVDQLAARLASSQNPSAESSSKAGNHLVAAPRRAA